MKITKKTIKVLSSDTRLKILKILSKRRRIAADLAKDLNLAPSTVNEHLKLLEEAELIKRNDTGHKWIYYEITEKGRNLVQPKTPMQFVLILSLGILIIIIDGFDFLQRKVFQTFEETSPMATSKGTEEVGRIGTQQTINWISLLILVIGIILILIGLHNIIKRK